MLKLLNLRYLKPIICIINIVTELKAAVQDFMTSVTPMTSCSTDRTELLLQPLIHYSMMNILSTVFEALSSNELVYTAR